MYNYEIDLNVMKQILDERNKKENSKKFDDILWYDLPIQSKIGDSDLKVTIRFLPPTPNAKVPGKVIKNHYNLPGEVKKWVCFQTYGLQCPIDDVLSEFKDRIDLKEFMPQERAYFNVLIVKDPSYFSRYQRELDTTKPHILRVGGFWFYWLIQKLLSPDVGQHIIDPVNGHNITVWRKTDGGAFEREISLKSSPIADSQDKIDQIISGMVDMDKIWRSPDDEYLKKTIKIAENLRKAINDRIINLGNSTLNFNQNNQVNKPINPEPQPEQKSIQKKPNITKQCFGNKAQYDESKKECIECQYEFQCQKEINKSN